MAKQPEFKDMSSAIRQMADNPLLYNNFIDAWDRLASEDTRTSDDLEREALHSLHAMQDREERKAHRNAMARDINRFPYPTCLTDRRGRFLATNGAALKHFKVQENDHVSDLGLELSRAESLEMEINKIATEVPLSREIALKRAYNAEGRALSVALLPSKMISAEAQAVLVFVIDPSLNMTTFDVLRDAFALTDSEFEVLAQFLTGDDLQNIAADRDTSLATVRTQFKTIMAKTETSSQAELVRTSLALLQFSEDVDQLARTNALSYRKRADVLRPGGRSVEVTIVGSPDAKPVLYLHGTFVGLFPASVERAFAKAGYFLIAVNRPGFGNTSPAKAGSSRRETLAADIVAVLDQLGINACPILAHSTATHSAISITSEIGDRITGVVLAAGFPTPDLIKSQSSQSPWARAMMSAAINAPTLLNVMTRAGMALFRTNGVAAQAAKSLSGSPRDIATISQQDSSHELEAWIEHGSKQGIDAGLRDIAVSLTDWSGVLAQISVPITYVHGDEDPVTPLASIQSIVARFPDVMSLNIVENAGHFAIWQEPSHFIEVFDNHP